MEQEKQMFSNDSILAWLTYYAETTNVALTVEPMQPYFIAFSEPIFPRRCARLQGPKQKRWALNSTFILLT